MNYELFDTLPKETKIDVFQFCDNATLYALRQANSTLYNLIHDSTSEGIHELRLWYLNGKNYPREQHSRVIDLFDGKTKLNKEYTQNLKEFKNHFHEYKTTNSLQQYFFTKLFEKNKNMKQKFIVLGGSVLNSIRRNEDEKFSEKTWNSNQDFDIYLVSNGESQEDCETIWKEAISELDRFKEEPFYLVRYANVCNCISKNGKKPIQFVFKKLECLEQVLLFSDLDCTRFAYDGESVYTVAEGIRALNTKTNVVRTKFKDVGKFRDRVIKYKARGFNTSFENLPILDSLKNPQVFNEPKKELDNDEVNIEEPYQEFYPQAPHFTFEELSKVIKGDMNDLTYQKRTVITRSKDFTVVKSADDLFTLNASRLIQEFAPAQELLSNYRVVKCYLCSKYRYLPPDSENPGMCCECFSMNQKMRKTTKDLSGKIAIVTGGRIKVGFATAMMLLRANAKVVVTSRFVKDTLQRFEKEPDFKKYRKNLEVYPLDMKSLEHVMEFTKYINLKFPRIHILINNAAQTVRKPLGYYNEVIAKDQKLLLAIESPKAKKNVPNKPNNIITLPLKNHLKVTSSALLPEDKKRYRESSRKDVFGEPIDNRSFNSWTYTLDEVDPREIAETNMINSIAPSVIISKLTEKMRISKDKSNSYIINVTSHEGRFNVEGKTDCHVHNNMSKAGLNMLTRSSAEFYAKKGILMNAVDPGWISSAFDTFIQPPLTCEDGAARILHPIFTSSKDYGKLLKDYKNAEW
eukprot:gene6190-10197_t